jgi:energy-coupling factor transporter ATP-binding protein EcfA2
MELEIKNCKNIESGKLTILENQLNIRYGANGTGKSTLAMAIESLYNHELITKMKPFSNAELEPKVELLEGVLPDSVKIFNEDYISNHLFIDSSVLDDKRVYEVLIKDTSLDTKKEALLSLFSDIKELCSKKEITSFISKINSMKSDLTMNNEKDKINGTSKVIKALKDGNCYIADNIPESLSDYQDLLVSEKRVQWIEWINNGHDFSDNCPYCREDLKDSFSDVKKEISSRYKKANVKNITSFLNELGNNVVDLNESTKQLISDKINNPDGLQTDDTEIITIYASLYTLIETLEKLCSLSEYDLLNEGETEKLLNDFLSTFNEIDFIKNNELIQILKSLKIKIEELNSKKTDYLKNKGIFDTAIKSKVNNSKKQINDFMQTAGIPYEIDFIDEKTKNPRVVLKHTNSDVSNILESLSFGEKNAFALMMFLMDVISENTQFIILDDPISSFDENKKYALMHALFLNDEDKCLKNRTVLMLTHDFTPIIDLTYVKKFDNINAKYLQLSENILTEHPITDCHIKNVVQVSKDMSLNHEKPLLSRLIEHRRYLELTKNNDDYQYDLISSVLKLKNVPQIKDNQGRFVDFTEDQINVACNKIKSELDFSDFIYDEVLTCLNDKDYLIDTFDDATDFEKINILRILSKAVNDKVGDDVLRKFILESYHIENTMTFQLDPEAFNTVPYYIISACQRYVDKHR